MGLHFIEISMFFTIGYVLKVDVVHGFEDVRQELSEVSVLLCNGNQSQKGFCDNKRFLR